jgi:hypothetical protein
MKIIDKKPQRKPLTHSGDPYICAHARVCVCVLCIDEKPLGIDEKPLVGQRSYGLEPYMCVCVFVHVFVSTLKMRHKECFCFTHMYLCVSGKVLCVHVCVCMWSKRRRSIVDAQKLHTYCLGVYTCVYTWSKRRRVTDVTAILIIIAGRETAYNGFEYQFTTGKSLKNLKLALNYCEDGSGSCTLYYWVVCACYTCIHGLCIRATN